MITLQAKNGLIEVNDVTIAALKVAWPTKDVPTELAKMHLWLLAHEKRRPVYWWVFLRNWMKKAPDVSPPPAPVGAGWWRDEARTMDQGRSIGLLPRPGEDMAAYRNRISTALQHRH